MSRQFIRKNIDVISSRVKKRPVTTDSSNSLNQDTITPNHLNHQDDEEGEVAGQEKTLIKNGLSPVIFQNYTLNSRSSKNNTGDDTSVSYQSAYDTIPRDTIKTVNTLSKKSEYELATQGLEETEQLLQDQPITYQSYSSLNADVPGQATAASVVPNETATNCVIYGLLRVWKILQQQLKERKRNREADDLERQPLLPSDGTPASSEESLEGRYVSCFDNYTLLVIVTILVGSILMLTVLFTGDTDLLIKIIQGLMCYLTGESLSRRLFGSEFCPKF